MWHWRCFPVFPKVDALWTSPDGLEGSSAFRRSGSKGSKGSKGGGIALSGDEYEVSVTGFTFSTIWYDKYSADWLAALATKGGNCGMVHEIYDSLFFLSILLVSP